MFLAKGMAPALLACAAIGAAIALSPQGLLLVAAMLVAGWIVLVAPATFVVATTMAVVLTSSLYFPVLGSIGDAEIRLSDVALVVLILAAALRGAPHGINRAHVLFACVVAWAFLRTGLQPGAISLGRIFLPALTAAFVVARLGTATQALRFVRWYAVISIVTAPLFRSWVLRWRGLPGDPAEIGLLSVTLVLLAVTADLSHRTRRLSIALGLAGLAGSRSVVSVVALVAGLAILSLRRELGLRSRARFFGATAAVGLGINLLRPDLMFTVRDHLSRAMGDGPTTTTARALGSDNPLIGTGWAPSALHNTYLDWLANLGIIGLLMLAVWLVFLYRQADTLQAKALLVTVAIWLNTTGAFPDPAWPLLGVVMAMMSFDSRSARDVRRWKPASEKRPLEGSNNDSAGYSAKR